MEEGDATLAQQEKEAMLLLAVQQAERPELGGEGGRSQPPQVGLGLGRPAPALSAGQALVAWQAQQAGPVRSQRRSVKATPGPRVPGGWQPASQVRLEEGLGMEKRAPRCAALRCAVQSMPRFMSEPVRGTHGWRAGLAGQAPPGSGDAGTAAGLASEDLALLHPQVQ